MPDIRRSHIPASGFLFMALLLLFSGCQKLYWYRSKVPTGKDAIRTIHFELINYAPLNLSPQFEKEIRAFCLQDLRKQGFVETPKKTRDFDFLITFKVDSFPTRAGKWLGPIDMGMPRESILRQLSISYYLYYPSTHVTYWDSKSEIYFFANERRDLRRSKSVARYAISTMY